MSPRLFRSLLNWWPPFRFAGIAVEYISPDYRQIKVALSLRWYNRNYVGTHFGGSLFSMTDPFYMLMLLQVLGKAYIVWDKSASIEFIRPGKGKVTAQFEITDAILQNIYQQTASGEKYLPEFQINIVDESGEIVARVTKQLYIRRKRKD